MELKSEDWKALIKEYEEGRLTKNEFCYEKGISVGSFKYRWRKEKEPHRKKEGLESKDLMAVATFEKVSIARRHSFPSTQASPSVISIQFPNHIRCDIPMPDSEPGLGLLLKQLVALC